MGKGIINWIFEGKIIQKRPCEKMSFFFAFTLGVIGYFIYLIFTNQYIYPIEYLWLALFAVGVGYIGVLYYRWMHHKTPLFIFNFWGKY